MFAGKILMILTFNPDCPLAQKPFALSLSKGRSWFDKVRQRNRRSLLYLGNFVDAIRLCIEPPAAAGQTFLLDDGEPVSTPELIRALARAMGRAAQAKKSLHCPTGWPSIMPIKHSH